MNTPDPSSCEVLWQLYVEQQLSLVAVAQQLGCSAPTVSARLRRCGIATRSGRFVARDLPRDLIEQLYLIEALPLAEIAARLGVSVSTIHNRRRAYGIPPRPRTWVQRASTRSRQMRITAGSENSLHF